MTKTKQKWSTKEALPATKPAKNKEEEGLDLQKKEEDECLATESKKEDDDES